MLKSIYLSYGGIHRVKPFQLPSLFSPPGIPTYEKH